MLARSQKEFIEGHRNRSVARLEWHQVAPATTSFIRRSNLDDAPTPMAVDNPITAAATISQTGESGMTANAGQTSTKFPIVNSKLNKTIALIDDNTKVNFTSPSNRIGGVVPDLSTATSLGGSPIHRADLSTISSALNPTRSAEETSAQSNSGSHPAVTLPDRCFPIFRGRRQLCHTHVQRHIDQIAAIKRRRRSSRSVRVQRRLSMPHMTQSTPMSQESSTNFPSNSFPPTTMVEDIVSDSATAAVPLADDKSATEINTDRDQSNCAATVDAAVDDNVASDNNTQATTTDQVTVAPASAPNIGSTPSETLQSGSNQE